MEAQLLEQFRAYIVTHHPELILRNQQEYPLSQYIRESMQSILPTLQYLEDQGKPEHEVLDLCMKEMIKKLGPSKADYLREVLKTEFPKEHHALNKVGTLTQNVVDLIRLCDEVFDAYGFSENNKDSNQLWIAIIVVVHDYLIDSGI
ncbi:hypothetical protein [Chitinophaga niabensis]|uniref:Uncharacterized protein n=1 Tax=Chitinophaga niabensis TaxID=536979 RepID=A0A1N6E4D6_9BACT|nr:hypothetical protein [Chitinophaga niabensis]SIN77882.1 hypothetical protein SAMN04488055_1294 [Chitinophaga niabensis]